MYKRQRAAQIRADRPDLASLTDDELVAHLRNLHPYIRDFTTNQMVAATSSGIPPGMLGAVAEAIGDPTMPMRVLAGLGDVDSAAPSFALWELSRLIRDDGELSEVFDEGVDGLLDRIETLDSPNAQQFRDDFDNFVYEYGSRGPNEWELSAHTWETDPSIPCLLYTSPSPRD